MYPWLMGHAFVEYDAIDYYFGDNVSNNWHNRNVVRHLYIRIECGVVHASFVHNFVRKRCNEIDGPMDS